MADAVVKLRSISRRFGPSIALAELTLDAPAGAVTVLLGPNGAGKTTAVRAITGALRVDGGEVRVFGLDPSNGGGEEVRRRCGVVAAKPALYDRLSGLDNLRYAAALYGVDGAAAAIDEAASRFGIDDALHLRVAGYSTGMRTRLALARAVLHDPDLLLLDEPTSGLDPESAHAVLGLIREMASGGKAVVMCTHLLLEAEGLADLVVMMEAGRSAVAGAPADLVRRYWPDPAVDVRLDAGSLEGLEEVAGVVAIDVSRGQVVVRSLDVVPDVVAALVARGARVRAVVPHEPTLEELYFAVRGAERSR